MKVVLREGFKGREAPSVTGSPRAMGPGSRSSSPAASSSSGVRAEVETPVPRGVVGRTLGEGQAVAPGVLASLDFPLRVSPPRDLLRSSHLGHFEGLWSGHCAA